MTASPWRIIGPHGTVALSASMPAVAAYAVDLSSEQVGADRRATTRSDALARATSFGDLLAAATVLGLSTKETERLAFLHAQDDVLTEEQEPLCLESARSAIGFLLTTASTLRPDILVNSEGNVQLEWYEAPYRKLVVEFTPDHLCRFVALYDQDQVAGLSTPASLAIRLSPYGVGHWLTPRTGWHAWPRTTRYQGTATSSDTAHPESSRTAG